MKNNQNFIIAIILSIAVLVLWQFLYVNPKLEAQRRASEIEEARQKKTKNDLTAGIDSAIPSPDVTDSGLGDMPTIPLTTSGGTKDQHSSTALFNLETDVQSDQRIPITSKRLNGSINLTGGRIDDVRLKDYRETTDANSPTIVLLSPKENKTGYIAEMGWVGNKQSGKVPDNTTRWIASDNAVLTPSSPVTLTLDQREKYYFPSYNISRQKLYVYG